MTDPTVDAAAVRAAADRLVRTLRGPLGDSATWEWGDLLAAATGRSPFDLMAAVRAAQPHVPDPATAGPRDVAAQLHRLTEGLDPQDRARVQQAIALLGGPAAPADAAGEPSPGAPPPDVAPVGTSTHDPSTLAAPVDAPPSGAPPARTPDAPQPTTSRPAEDLLVPVARPDLTPPDLARPDSPPAGATPSDQSPPGPAYWDGPPTGGPPDSPYAPPTGPAVPAPPPGPAYPGPGPAVPTPTVLPSSHDHPLPPSWLPTPGDRQAPQERPVGGRRAQKGSPARRRRMPVGPLIGLAIIAVVVLRGCLGAGAADHAVGHGPADVPQPRAAATGTFLDGPQGG